MSTAEPEADDPDNAMDLEFVTADETTCTICYAEFLDKADLDIHVKQVHKSGSKLCDFCLETYTDMIDYATHIRDNHLQDIRCCNYCSKVIKDPNEVSNHQKLHTSYSDSYYSCSQCVGLFSTTRQLELHELLHHEDTSDTFHLPCMVYLSSILNCKAATVLQASGNCFFICNSCDFTAVDLENYKKHLSEGNCLTFICDNCSSFFKNKKAMIRHFTKRKTNCNEFIDNVKCINCKEHINYLELRDHLKNCQLIKCKNCDNLFQTVEQLSLHQQKEHPQSISNTCRCTFCNKLFVGKIAMKKHVKRAHRPYFHLYKYMCKTCGSIFPHPQKLFAHYYVQHREILPYTCKLCDKTFRVRKQFTIHIKVQHKGEGFVEFDENYHVYFTDKKPEKPFIPKCVINDNLDTDSEEEQVKKQKKKRTPKPKPAIPWPKPIKLPKIKCRDSSSEEEPLEQIRKRSKKPTFKVRTDIFTKKRRKQLTCQECQKYCYTHQNFLNHMSLHKKSEKITCVKCNSTFKTAKELEKHTQTEHTTSLLTETLKKVLEKRKLGPDPAQEETMSQKFMKTIKKVKFEKTFEPAKILPAPEKDLSVKKFLENFTPDLNAEKPKCKIDSSLTIKKYESPYYRKETIRMSKFDPQTQINLNKPAKLKMPQKFKETEIFKPEISINLVQKSFDHDYDMNGDDDHQNYYDDDDKNIPEVAQEVMLEDTVEDRPQNTPKIVLPKLPIDYPDIHVATLQTQAPYFKITKVTDQKSRRSKNRRTIPEKPPGEVQTIELKDGTKLVSTNPLAHLLGDKQVDEIIKPTKSSYVPKNKIVTNVQGALVQALQKLDKTLEQKRVLSRKRKAKSEMGETKKRAPRSKKKAEENLNITPEDVEMSQEVQEMSQEVQEMSQEVEETSQDAEITPQDAEITLDVKSVA